MESKVFTADLDDQLIAKVRNHPVLYSSFHKSNKNSAIKEQVWQSISAALDVNIDDCKMRWRTIRDSYKRNIKKVKANITTGSQAISKSKYFNKNLQFLEDAYKGRRATTKLNLTAVSSTAITENASDPTTRLETNNGADDTADDEEIFTQRVEELYTSQLTDLEHHTSYEEPAKKKNKPLAKGKIIRETKPGCEERQLILKEILSGNQTKSNRVHALENPVDLFFKSMSETVKSFPRHLQAEARLKVCQVVIEMELKAITEASNFDINRSGPSNRALHIDPSLEATRMNTYSENSGNSSNDCVDDLNTSLDRRPPLHQE